jgi:glyoxylase-like metal-dependent hydrolase (beta-lactamase superfamily II)
VHAPGHTDGSAALLLEDRGIMFTGDVLCTWNAYTGRTGPQIMPSGLNADTPRALASLANLSGIQAGMLLPGHGEPWTGGVEDAIRRARAAGPSLSRVLFHPGADRRADRAEEHLDRAPAAHRPGPRLTVRIRLRRRGHPCRSL